MKQSEAKFKSIFRFFSLFFTFFHFFSLFFRFFCFFSLFFALNFSLRFDLVIFASKRNKAKRNSSLFFRFFRFFSIFHFFFAFFAFFRFFSLNFRFASIFSLHFRLFYLRFCFRFLVFCTEVNHVKSGFFFASKRNEIFASISNFASEAKVRAHPSLSPRWNWDPCPSPASECALPPGPGGGGGVHTLLRVRGWGVPIRTTGEKA
jgi:hypothetical protein